MNNLRVVTSCRSRFHIFDQARELAKHGNLYRLIADYPKSYVEKFDIPVDAFISLFFLGLINHGLGRVLPYGPKSIQSIANKWVHNKFSSVLPDYIPLDTQYFIGLSSFCLEGLKFCTENKIPSAVDHGSLHQFENRELVFEEASRWGLSKPRDLAADWVIDKENKEFDEANTIFVPSSVARDSLIRQGIPQEKIFVNACGVNLDKFYPDHKNDNVFRVIQVGSITVGKGVLTLIDAFMKASINNSELLFLGSGFNNSEIKDRVSYLNPSNVSFHSPVPQDKLRNWYNNSSVFVLASVADGFGMVVTQAMACGLPIVVTENVGAKDLIKDGINGFIVPVGSPETIAERLKELYENPELRTRMGLEAQKTIKNGYTWEDYGNRLNSYLQKNYEVK